MKKAVLLFCVLFVLTATLPVSADGVDSMLKGKQDYTILGSVKDISNGIVMITVDHVLGRNGSDMVGSDLAVAQFAYSYCEEHSSSEFRSPKVSDNILISLDKTDGGYKMANCAYKVDSNEYASCKIVIHEDFKDEDCLKTLLEATCFVRSNAKVSEFEFDEDGRIYAVYPQTSEQCLYIVGDDGAAVITEETPDTLPTVPPAAPQHTNYNLDDNRWILALCVLFIGVMCGALFSYFIVLKRNK